MENRFGNREEPAPPNVPQAPPPDVVDWSEALRSVQGNRALLRTVIEAALEEFPRLLAEMRRAVDQRDKTKLRLAAHTLKGSLRYLGTARVFDDAYRLEVLGRDGALDESPQALEALQADVEKIMAALVGYLKRP